MKKTAFLLLIFVFAQSFDVKQALVEDPTMASMNTRSYEFFPDAKMTPAPEGYKPFYIVQYARHGARTNTNAGNCERILTMLDTARKKGLLTPAADTVYAEAKYVLEMTKGHEGALLPRGQEEHEQLAARLFERYGEVFKNGAKNGRCVRVKCTTSHRVLLSMAAFTNQLTRMVPDIKYEMTAAPCDEFTVSNGPSDMHKKDAKNLTENILKDGHDRSYLMKRLFTDPEAAAAMIKPHSLEANIYHTARFSEPIGRGTVLYRYLSPEALYHYWLHSASILYLYNCNSVEFGDERMPRCQALVDMILDKAEDAIAGEKVCSDLYFGHDYPLLALVSRFGIEGVGDRMTVQEIGQKWTDPTNISFASNLQMIFFKNKKGIILVKFIYNDRERKLIGIEAEKDCYYRWNDIKSRVTGLSGRSN